MKRLSKIKLISLVITILGFFVTLPVGSVLIARETDKKNIEELPPEPEAPPAVKQDIEELSLPEGKEAVLDVYKVVRGDYFAKIAKREYGDYSLWRIIYNYNKYINDPNWIFPGDKIILPVIVDKIPPVSEVSGKEESKETEIDETRDYGDFLAQPDFNFEAAISGFKKQKVLHSQGDLVFIDIGRDAGLTENQRLYVYRRGRTIVHPYTGELLGDVVEMIGVIQVTSDIENSVATAKIVYSDRSVNKGDLLLLAK